MSAIAVCILEGSNDVKGTITFKDAVSRHSYIRTPSSSFCLKVECEYD